MVTKRITVRKHPKYNVYEVREGNKSLGMIETKQEAKKNGN
jgi:hypothetical protein